MLTLSSAADILQKLSKVDFGALSDAFSARGANLQADAAAANVLIQALGDIGVIIPGGPILAIEISVAAEIIALILQYGTQDRPGSQLPSWAGGSSARGSDPNM